MNRRAVSDFNEGLATPVAVGGGAAATMENVTGHMEAARVSEVRNEQRRVRTTSDSQTPGVIPPTKCMFFCSFNAVVTIVLSSSPHRIHHKIFTTPNLNRQT